MSIALICICLLAALVLLMGFTVSLVRARTKTLYGCTEAPDSALFKAIRAHSNTVEYVPVLLVLIYILGQQPQPVWVGVSMIGVTFCRFLLVAGLLIPKTLAKPNAARFVGALGTYVFGLLLVLAVALQML